MIDRRPVPGETWRERLAALADAYAPGRYALADGVCHVYYLVPSPCSQIRDDLIAALESSDKDRVRFPSNPDEAATMVLLGERWLRDHAPERLKRPSPDAPTGYPK